MGKRKKQRKWKILIISIICVLLTSIMVFLILDSNFFDIKKIEVIDINGDRFTNEEIIDLSGFVEGTNIVKMKLDVMERNIETAPFIKKASIKKRYPNSLTITIEERMASTCFVFLGQYLILDGEGYVVEILKENKNLTYIDGFTVVDFVVGEKLKVENEAEFDEVLSLLRVMEKKNMFFKKITNEHGSVIVNIYDKLVAIGTVQEIEENMESLNGIIYDLYKKGIKRGVIRLRDNGYFSYSPTD